MKLFNVENSFNICEKPRNIHVCTYILPCYDVHTLLSRAEVMELEATITEGQNWSAVYYHTHTHFCHSHL